MTDTETVFKANTDRLLNSQHSFNVNEANGTTQHCSDSTTTYSLPLIAVSSPISVYWILRRRSTQSTMICCYINSITCSESKVRPRNGSSPT